jgi:hypothetical protein
MLRAFLISLFVIQLSLMGSYSALAQHQVEEDSTVEARTIADFFHAGVFGGHVRNFTMATVHHSDLLESEYANAIGARIDYRSAYFHGFQIGLTGLFTFNLASSNLHEPNASTGRLPRYELQLFDMMEPHKKGDMDRLDELYLHYRYKENNVKIGRFAVESPLMNTLDTRMKPYAFQGVWLDTDGLKNTSLHMGWIENFSPRGTIEWFPAGESIGVYDAGFNPDGTPSGYSNHVATRGVWIVGMENESLPHLGIKAWNYLIDNVSNTFFLNTEFHQDASHHEGLSAGLQFLYQTQLGNGGHAEASKRYFADGNVVRLWSGMLAFRKGNKEVSLNGIMSGSEGRFTFPREWGRENFFTTAPRTRMEGLGNAESIMLKYLWEPTNTLLVESYLGRTWVKDSFQWNKYGNVSHDQLILDVNFHPHEAMEGLSLRLLYVYKRAIDRQLSPMDVYYTADFHHINLVTNIAF